MIMYLVNILVAGYGIAHFKVHLVVSAFRSRDRTLTLNKNLWSEPLSKATVSQLCFQLMTSSLKISSSFGIKSWLSSLFGRSSVLKFSTDRHLARGLSKIESSLDIVTLVRTQKRLKALENLLLTGPQKIVHKMNRWNYLSENSSSSSDQEYPDPTLLENERFETALDGKLIENAYKSKQPGITKLQRILNSVNTFPTDIDLTENQSQLEF